jgi:uncharacterized lipoprotein YmbA
MMRPLSLLALSVVAAGCSSGPPRNLYSLSAPVDPAAGISNVTAQPVIQLQPVTLPDYLDTTDILLRSGKTELKVSATGRWAERLSDGLNHALTADLMLRLPGDQVTAAPPTARFARQIRVSVEAFDVRPDGHCILTAAWTILDKDSAVILVSERGAFVASAKASSANVGDADIVSAMAVATGQLADAIAAEIIKVQL